MDVRILGEYQNFKSKIETKCNVCGHIWQPQAGNLAIGEGCPECAAKKRAERNRSQRKTHAEFIEQMKTIAPNIEFTSEYETAIKKIGCKCNECGHEWTAKPTNLLSGFGCPKCYALRRGSIRRGSHDRFIEKMNKRNPNVEILSTYSRIHDKVSCKCKKCGSEWWAEPGNLLAGSGCPSCKESRGEKAIRSILHEICVPCEYQKKYPELLGVGGSQLSYDFYLPDDNLLIEFQGEYHDNTSNRQSIEEFDIQREHDKRKREYANNNGIHLLEIWYYDKNIESMILGALSNCKKNPSTITV